MVVDVGSIDRLRYRKHLTSGSGARSADEGSLRNMNLQYPLHFRELFNDTSKLDWIILVLERSLPVIELEAQCLGGLHTERSRDFSAPKQRRHRFQMQMVHNGLISQCSYTLRLIHRDDVRHDSIAKWPDHAIKGAC